MVGGRVRRSAHMETIRELLHGGVGQLHEVTIDAGSPWRCWPKGVRSPCLDFCFFAAIAAAAPGDARVPRGGMGKPQATVLVAGRISRGTGSEADEVEYPISGVAVFPAAVRRSEGVVAVGVLAGHLVYCRDRLGQIARGAENRSRGLGYEVEVKTLTDSAYRSRS
jgi:hypothetical protein